MCCGSAILRANRQECWRRVEQERGLPPNDIVGSVRELAGVPGAPLALTMLLHFMCACPHTAAAPQKYVVRYYRGEFDPARVRFASREEASAAAADFEPEPEPEA